ncbi:E3 ubiquitin-protein ligase UPL5 [Hordeum vulgare]|nr:E3 ubiquitin-protein ligase UPL5 [Hordeum vulgare]
MLVTAPVLLQFCRLLSLTAGNKDSLHKSCRYTLASVLCLPLSGLAVSKSPTKVIEQVLPFAREIVELVLNGLASESMMASRTDLEEVSNFFKALRQQVLLWIPKNMCSTGHGYIQRLPKFLSCILHSFPIAVKLCHAIKEQSSLVSP